MSIDFGVLQGELDEVLQGSAQLRDTCLLVLISVGRLISSCMCSDLAFVSDKL
jgi:hypothetical protein